MGRPPVLDDADCNCLCSDESGSDDCVYIDDFSTENSNWIDKPYFNEDAPSYSVSGGTLSLNGSGSRTLTILRPPFGPEFILWVWSEVLPDPSSVRSGVTIGTAGQQGRVTFTREWEVADSYKLRWGDENEVTFTSALTGGMRLEIIDTSFGLGEYTINCYLGPRGSETLVHTETDISIEFVLLFIHLGVIGDESGSWNSLEMSPCPVVCKPTVSCSSDVLLPVGWELSVTGGQNNLDSEDECVSCCDLLFSSWFVLSTMFAIRRLMPDFSICPQPQYSAEFNPCHFDSISLFKALGWDSNECAIEVDELIFLTAGVSCHGPFILVPRPTFCKEPDPEPLNSGALGYSWLPAWAVAVESRLNPSTGVKECRVSATCIWWQQTVDINLVNVFRAAYIGEWTETLDLTVGDTVLPLDPTTVGGVELEPGVLPCEAPSEITLTPVDEQTARLLKGCDPFTLCVPRWEGDISVLLTYEGGTTTQPQETVICLGGFFREYNGSGTLTDCDGIDKLVDVKVYLKSGLQYWIRFTYVDDTFDEFPLVCDTQGGFSPTAYGTGSLTELCGGAAAFAFVQSCADVKHPFENCCELTPHERCCEIRQSYPLIASFHNMEGNNCSTSIGSVGLSYDPIVNTDTQEPLEDALPGFSHEQGYYIGGIPISGITFPVGWKALFFCNGGLVDLVVLEANNNPSEWTFSNVNRGCIFFEGDWLIPTEVCGLAGQGFIRLSVG